MKLTDRKIKNLKAKNERYEIWEGDGLGIRVTPRCVKSWVFLYRFEGKARRLTLGRYPMMTVAQAHAAHGKALEKLDKGIDPGELEVEARRRERHAPTVGDLAEEYMELWAKPRKRSWNKDQSILDRDVLPRWGRRKAKAINRRDVVLLLDEIVERGAPIQANRTLEIVRRMYNFAIERDVVPQNPCLQVKAPAREHQRDRVLSPEEIRIVWATLGGTEVAMAPATALALKLQLLTAQRKGEVAGAQWSEIDFSENVWTIPAENAKNKLPHRVPLSPQALTVLGEIKSLAGKARWLFPSPRHEGQAHIAETAIDRAVRNNRDVFGIAHWVPHDLRRTAASSMTSMGISRLAVAKILNHVEPGITAVYDRHSYDSEKRQALETWGRRLAQIVTGEQEDNVIQLTR